MFENKSTDQITTIPPDMGVVDIDIDLKLNNGKGAWVVVLLRQEELLSEWPDAEEQFLINQLRRSYRVGAG